MTRRAETELEVSGVRPSAAEPAPQPVEVTRLSPQELRIARTVAGGLNNAEATAALYLSRKTVEAHLTAGTASSGCAHAPTSSGGSASGPAWRAADRTGSAAPLAGSPI